MQWGWTDNDAVTLPVSPKSEATGMVLDAARRFAGALRKADDPERTAIGHWNIGQVGAHVSHIYGMYPGLVRGEKSPLPDHLNLAPDWEQMLRKDPERNLGVLADRIQKHAEDFTAAVEDTDWEGPVTWHGGKVLPVYSLAALLANEAEMHGFDVTHAEKKLWSMSERHAQMILEGHYPVLPYFLIPSAADFEAVYELRPRGLPSVFFKVDRGTVDIDAQAQGKVDCRITVRAVDYLLVGYRRRSQAPAVLTGKILATGSKPWLGLRFAKLFQSP
jgi:hypothetical protein